MTDTSSSSNENVFRSFLSNKFFRTVSVSLSESPIILSRLSESRIFPIFILSPLLRADLNSEKMCDTFDFDG